ncbi:MAG: hypothetical protein RLZ10_2998 [Bacteroidota bacterium]|jgi:hypothetical protein
MWYRFSSNKNILKKYNIESILIDDNWFESVPGNIWILNGTKIDIVKSFNIENGVPNTSYSIRKNKKEVNKISDIEKALKFAENYNA